MTDIFIGDADGYGAEPISQTARPQEPCALKISTPTQNQGPTGSGVLGDHQSSARMNHWWSRALRTDGTAEGTTKSQNYAWEWQLLD